MSELLEKARENQGDISYYEVAKRLGVSTPLMNKWKNNKSQPNGVHTLELAVMAGLRAEDALKIVRNENGFINLNLVAILGVTALLSMAYMNSGLPTLYIM